MSPTYFRNREDYPTNWIDLGENHRAFPTCWSPDRKLNPQYENIPDIPLMGYQIEHNNAATGEPCMGHVNLDLPGVRQLVNERAVWNVESLDPLTISPSILCDCGDHGYIQNGKWIGA